MPNKTGIKKDRVIGIFCSDIHLQHKAPILRSKEPDWYAAMQRPLNEIKRLQKQNGECPVFCCGDVFDTWDSNAELINWSMQNLPDGMYCVPGQHDLPEHDPKQIRRSAYNTLLHTGILDGSSLPLPLKPSSFLYQDDNYRVYGAWYGEDLPKPGGMDVFNIGIMHKYICKSGHSHAKAAHVDFVDRLLSVGSNCHHYDIVFFGDNHSAFIQRVGNTLVVNCGCMIRRHKNELQYEPSIWLLLENGSVKRHRLDLSQDIYLEMEDTPTTTTEDSIDISEFIDGLEKLGDSTLDFVRICKQYIRMKQVGKTVKRMLLDSIGE